MKTATCSKTSAGFSLIEMMMTVAILGIMTSLALGWYGGSANDVKQARDQRNAQSICMLCQAVDAAGINLATEAVSSLDIARKMAAGVTIEKGVLKGRTFQVPGLREEEIEGAARFLTVSGGQVRYEAIDKAKDGETPQGEPS